MLFRGKYWFLSNMFPSRISLNGYSFSCVEAAFQACKCPSRVEEFTKMNGFEAKKLGRQVPLPSDWDKNKLKYMKIILKAKFSDPKLMEQLKSINEPIVEDNGWKDTFWGRYLGFGENHLGKLLMEIRDGN